MDFRGCRKESVDYANRASGGFVARHSPAPSLCHFDIDGQDSFFESQRQFVLYPMLEPGSTASCGQAFHSVVEFCQGYDTDEDAIFVGGFHPVDETRVRTRFDPFGNCVGVEKEAHKSVFRGRSLRRRIFRPDLRRGDSARNWARLPTRLVFRCHSSAPTTTAAVRPLRVMVCGPSDMARSIISLNFALASATVQFWELMGGSSRCIWL